MSDTPFNPTLSLTDRSLTYLAEKGHLDELKARLAALPTQDERDGKVNTATAPFGDTPLHSAAHMAQEAVVLFLLNDTVADSTRKDARGYLPIERAARKGHTGICIMMLERGERASGGAKLGRLFRLALQARKWKTAHEIAKRMNEEELFKFMDAPMPLELTKSDTAFAVAVDARGEDARAAAEAAGPAHAPVEEAPATELESLYTDARVAAMRARGFPASILPILQSEAPSLTYSWVHNCLTRPLERAIAHSERDPAALEFAKWLISNDYVSLACLMLEVFPHSIQLVPVPDEEALAVAGRDLTADETWSRALQAATKLACKGFGIALSTNPKALALMLRTPPPLPIAEIVAGSALIITGSVPERVLSHIKVRTAAAAKACRSVMEDMAWERRKHLANLYAETRSVWYGDEEDEEEEDAGNDDAENGDAENDDAENGDAENV